MITKCDMISIQKALKYIEKKFDCCCSIRLSYDNEIQFCIYPPLKRRLKVFNFIIRHQDLPHIEQSIENAHACYCRYIKTGVV